MIMEMFVNIHVCSQVYVNAHRVQWWTYMNVHEHQKFLCFKLIQKFLTQMEISGVHEHSYMSTIVHFFSWWTFIYVHQRSYTFTYVHILFMNCSPESKILLQKISWTSRVQMMNIKWKIDIPEVKTWYDNPCTWIFMNIHVRTCTFMIYIDK